MSSRSKKNHPHPQRPNGHGHARIPGDHVAAVYVTSSTDLWCYIEGRNWLVQIGGFDEVDAGPRFLPGRLRILPMGDDFAPLDLSLGVFAETYRASTGHPPPEEARAPEGAEDQVESVGMDFDRQVMLRFVASGFRYDVQIGALQATPRGPQLVSNLMVLRPVVAGDTTQALMRLGDFAVLYRQKTGTRIVLPPSPA